MKTHDAITRKVFHSIHKNQIISKTGFKRVKNLLNCENLKLPKNYFKNKICASFGCGSTGAEGQNLLELGANYVHLLDLDKHIINPINKNLKKYKGKYQIDIGSIEKTSYKNNYFDFILCSGVIHHLENDINGLKEIHRTLKKGGNCHLMVHGSGGLLSKFTMDILRPEYKRSPVVRKFLKKIMSGDLKSYEKFMIKNYDNESIQIIKLMKKYFDKDLLLTIKDRILAPKYKTYNVADLKTLLKKIGFKNIYRIQKKVKFKNIRRLLVPFYFNYKHEMSRALYGNGNIALVMTKK